MLYVYTAENKSNNSFNMLIYVYTVESDSFKIFLQSIFYIGKGKRSRPFEHFKEAVSCSRNGLKQVCCTSSSIFTLCLMAYNVYIKLS